VGFGGTSNHNKCHNAQVERREYVVHSRGLFHAECQHNLKQKCSINKKNYHFLIISIYLPVISKVIPAAKRSLRKKKH
jgi:hypothetical protein